MLSTIRTALSGLIKGAAEELGGTPSTISFSLETPVIKEHGDLACNVALQLTKTLRRNPLDIANALKAALDVQIQASSLRGQIQQIEVVKPGFLNFRLSPSAFYEIVMGATSIGKWFFIV